jgi:hypothetical protein
MRLLHQVIDPVALGWSDHEREGGTCPVCGTAARLLSCWACCDSAWVIDCAHRSGPAPVRIGRRDGCDPHRTFCDECAES